MTQTRTRTARRRTPEASAAAPWGLRPRVLRGVLLRSEDPRRADDDQDDGDEHKHLLEHRHAGGGQVHPLHDARRLAGDVRERAEVPDRVDDHGDDDGPGPNRIALNSQTLTSL